MVALAPRSLSKVLAATVTAAVLAATSFVPAMSPPAVAATRVPPVPTGLPAGIEAPSAYVRQNSCSLVAQPGTLKLAALLKQTYPTIPTGMTRVCSTAGSEHHDGRAIDWMVSIRNREQAAYASALLGWLLATDRAGNRYANARRLGVMYLIWDEKILSLHSADRGWRPYRDCASRPERSSDSVCHRDHIHISLSWAGARARTSYWTKKVAAPDFGPCRAADLNWARYYTTPRATPCPSYPTVLAPPGASATLRALTPYSGIYLRQGSTGNAVKALQKALGVTQDGIYGPKTAAAVERFQRAHGIAASGRVGYTVWRALLKEHAPAAGARTSRDLRPAGPGPDRAPDEGDA